jgi:hypothetical protein
MSPKQQVLASLNAEFERWEELLAGLSEAQITASQLPANLSLKDVVAHLRAWQQVSIARLEAAQLNREPHLPDWLLGADPEAEEELDHFNARIYDLYRAEPWPAVHQAWREGFRKFLKLAEAIPENELMDREKYPWLKGYALVAVLEGSYDHHAEHFAPLPAWINRPDQPNRPFKNDLMANEKSGTG